MRQLQRAITFLEELQECQKRPTKYGNIDAQQLITALLDPITDDLKQLQIELETKNDHGGNHDH